MEGEAVMASGSSAFFRAGQGAGDGMEDFRPVSPGARHAASSEFNNPQNCGTTRAFRVAMLTYAYQARDQSGKMISGIQDAVNEDNCVNTLMGRGLMVLSLQQKAGSKALRSKGKVSETDLVLFTRQLATMVDAGLPLVTALTALYEQADPRKQAGLRRIVGEVSAQVQQGDTFTESVAKHPNVFSRLYIAMVKAGESGGLLAEILNRLASFLESASRLKKKVKSAMTYPVIVICIAASITTFLIVRVVPVFGEIFADFGANLPGPTQFLLDVSAFIRGNWWLILLGMGGTFFGIKTFLKTEKGRQLWDRYKLKLPIFGPLIHKICMTRFARTFAQLIRSGVPILEVMEIVGDTAGNYVVEAAIRNVAADVEKGDQLTNSLARQPVFPPMLIRMVSAGEQTGKIDTMLEKMADFWDEEIEAILDALTSLIEPLLIVVLGVIVGGIVIAMFLPIFKLNDVVSQAK
ncbi:MAG: type pilus assembly protein PilC [Chthoniobacter sp.]|jgi:type IV pilus assembly protein PilC|nr:type pilus assembly protein PilC [Chthoniobacter sp.]